MSYVEGSYATPHEALLAVKRLEEEGFRTEDIRLVANNEVHDSFVHKMDIKVYVKEPYEDEMDEDASIWEKVKDAFSTVEDYGDDSKNPEDDPLFYYRANIDAGKIIVCVEESKAIPTSEKDSVPPSNQKEKHFDSEGNADPKDDLLLDQSTTSDYDKRK